MIKNRYINRWKLTRKKEENWKANKIYNSCTQTAILALFFFRYWIDCVSVYITCEDKCWQIVGTAPPQYFMKNANNSNGWECSVVCFCRTTGVVYKPSPNTLLFIWLIKGLSGVLKPPQYEWTEFSCSRKMCMLYVPNYPRRMCVVSVRKVTGTIAENMWITSYTGASKIYVYEKTYQA